MHEFRPLEYEYLWHQLQDDYEEMIEACASQGFMINILNEDLPMSELMPEEHIFLLCRDLIEFCHFC